MSVSLRRLLILIIVGLSALILIGDVFYLRRYHLFKREYLRGKLSGIFSDSVPFSDVSPAIVTHLDSYRYVLSILSHTSPSEGNERREALKKLMFVHGHYSFGSAVHDALELEYFFLKAHPECADYGDEFVRRVAWERAARFRDYGPVDIWLNPE
jgi:hypothetical protein